MRLGLVHLLYLNDDASVWQCLRTVSSGICHVSRLAGPWSIIPVDVDAFLLDGDRMSPGLAGPVRRILENHPDFPVVVIGCHSASSILAAMLSRVPALYLSGELLRKDLVRVVAEMAIVRAENEKSPLVDDFYGLDRPFGMDAWNRIGMGPLVFCGSPGGLQERAMQDVAGKLGGTWRLLDASRPFSLDGPNENHRVMLENFEGIGRTDLDRLLVQMATMSTRSRPVPFLAASTGMEIACVEDPEFLSRLFGAGVLRLVPLKDRWVDFRRIGKMMFRRECARKGTTLPVEFDGEAMQLLGTHSWPGNLEELDQLVRKSCSMCRDAVVGVRHLSAMGWRPDGKRNGPVRGHESRAR